MNSRDIIAHDIKNIRLGSFGSKKKPHKLIFLLSIIELQCCDVLNNKIFISEKLELKFKSLWEKYINDIAYSPSLIEIPYCHLRGDGFWNFSIKPEKEQKFKSYERITKKRIIECVDYGYFNELWNEILSSEEDRMFARSIVLECLESINYSADVEPKGSECCENKEDYANIFDIQGNSPKEKDRSECWHASCNLPSSPFISYLNSLHCIDANSHGALAEAQASSPMFHEIHVRHPWTDMLASSLLDPVDRRHVVLTGHAGDGKSTIALELYKILTGRKDQQSLPDGLPKRADVPGGISIVKDLSEWTNAEQDGLLDEMAAGSRRFFLVSNTGCLLNLLRRQAGALGSSPMAMENSLLAAMETSNGETLTTKAGRIAIHNLGRHDNVDLALKMLERLASSRRWDECRQCACRCGCPIAENLSIFRQRQTLVLERLRLLLRRTTDYGSRTTMRQLSAHFAYMLTSGLSCEAVADVLRKKQSFRLEEHMFFNRFWGDDGWNQDVRAAQLQSCRLIAAQGFGTVLAPSMERMLWQMPEASWLDLGLPELTDVTKRLLRHARMRSLKLVQAKARMQIRRMAYFLLENSPALPQMDRFLGAFLNSPTLCSLQEWLQDPRQLDRKLDALKEQLLHLLQEQFSGIRLPTGPAADATLHVGLNRRQRGIRQNVQVLLGTIDFNDKFDLGRQSRSDGSAELVLVGKDELAGISMRLDLPLLDYVAARHSGAVGSILRSSYANRLESLKSSLLRHCSKPEADELVLLKLDAGSRPRRLRAIMSEKGLEVANG